MSWVTSRDRIVRVVGPSAAMAKRALGTDLVPVTSMEPKMWDLDGLGLRLCYLVDLSRLSMMDRCGVADEIARVAKSTRIEALKDMRTKGVPLRVEICEMIEEQQGGGL